MITQSDAEKSFPAVTPPAEGAQAQPAQEPGKRAHRPAQSQPHADAAVNRSANTVTATLSNGGKVGVSLVVYPDKYLPASATPFTVVKGADKTYTWAALPASKNGYAFSVYGPDGFVRTFAGQVVPAGTTSGQIPSVTATLSGQGGLHLTLANDGSAAVTYTLTANDYGTGAETVTVGPRGSKTVKWAASADGYYDVIITADTSDGFTRRYAGRTA